MLHRRPLSPICKSVIRLKTLSESLSGIFMSLIQMQRKGFLWISKEKGEKESKHYYSCALREV